MLNEKLEYEQYTCSLDDSAAVASRLKHKTITPDLKGLNRAMTIIARHFLYPSDSRASYEEADEGHKENLKALAETALRAWCGHKQPQEIDPPEIHLLYNWLPRYMASVLTAAQVRTIKKNPAYSLLSTEKKWLFDERLSALYASGNADEYARNIKSLTSLLPESAENRKIYPGLNNILRAMATLKNAKTVYSRAHFSKADDAQKNDRNTITYERIIGNAIRLGPLKQYCLACCSRIPATGVYKKSGGKGRTINDNAKDIILKMTAACLLKLTENGSIPYTLSAPTERVKAVQVTIADVENWLCKAKLEKADREAFLYRGSAALPVQNMPLFETVALSENSNNKDNILKIRLNGAWLYDCGWTLIPDEGQAVSEFLRKNPDGCVYQDCGACKGLRSISSIRSQGTLPL